MKNRATAIILLFTINHLMLVLLTHSDLLFQPIHSVLTLCSCSRFVIGGVKIAARLMRFDVSQLTLHVQCQSPTSLAHQTDPLFFPPHSCVKQVRFEAPVLLMSNEANPPNPVMMSSETRPPQRRRPSSLPVSRDSLGGLIRLVNSTVQILPQSQASCSLKTTDKHGFA